jgi:hypothetical protein
MSAFLKNRGFEHCGSNGQPKAHYKLPFRIQDWKKTVEVSDEEYEETGRYEYDIRVDFIIAEDPAKSFYLIYRIDQYDDDDPWTDGVRVMKSEGKELFDKVVEYVQTLPASLNNSNMSGIYCGKEAYEAILAGEAGIPAAEVV